MQRGVDKCLWFGVLFTVVCGQTFATTTISALEIPMFLVGVEAFYRDTLAFSICAMCKNCPLTKVYTFAHNVCLIQIEIRQPCPTVLIIYDTCARPYYRLSSKELRITFDTRSPKVHSQKSDLGMLAELKTDALGEKLFCRRDGLSLSLGVPSRFRR